MYVLQGLLVELLKQLIFLRRHCPEKLKDSGFLSDGLGSLMLAIAASRIFLVASFRKIHSGLVLDF